MLGRDSRRFSAWNFVLDVVPSQQVLHLVALCAAATSSCTFRTAAAEGLRTEWERVLNERA